MSKLLRYYSDGQVYFITMVTHQRRHLLIRHHDMFWGSLAKFRAEMDFRIIAHVELPDHAPLIIDPGKCNLSSIIQKVKLSFSKKVTYALSEGSTRIWQTRFWDHIIRDEADMNKHIDYVHFNPVKHGYAVSPHEWRFSSFHDYLEAGLYPPNWGRTPIHELQGEYGE